MLYTNIEDFFSENIKEPALFDFKATSSDIEISNKRASARGDLSYDNQDYHYTLIIEYNDNLQKAYISQLTIDDINISL